MAAAVAAVALFYASERFLSGKTVIVAGAASVPETSSDIGQPAGPLFDLPAWRAGEYALFTHRVEEAVWDDAGRSLVETVTTLRYAVEVVGDDASGVTLAIRPHEFVTVGPDGAERVVSCGDESRFLATVDRSGAVTAAEGLERCVARLFPEVDPFAYRGLRGPRAHAAVVRIVGPGLAWGCGDLVSDSPTAGVTLNLPAGPCSLSRRYAVAGPENAIDLTGRLDIGARDAGTDAALGFTAVSARIAFGSGSRLPERAEVCLDVPMKVAVGDQRFAQTKTVIATLRRENVGEYHPSSSVTASASESE
ncbi:MAG: hypothetical protein AAGJ97_03795 [Planctomycetota bacterium]